jgi:hypothetical protein
MRGLADSIRVAENPRWWRGKHKMREYVGIKQFNPGEQRLSGDIPDCDHTWARMPDSLTSTLRNSVNGLKATITPWLLQYPEHIWPTLGRPQKSMYYR